jgi:hypothetical protein
MIARGKLFATVGAVAALAVGVAAPASQACHGGSNHRSHDRDHSSKPSHGCHHDGDDNDGGGDPLPT